MAPRAARAELELGKTIPTAERSKGKGRSKGSSKGGSISKGSGKSSSKGGSSKSKGCHRRQSLLVAEEKEEESDFMNAHAAKEREDIVFWNRRKLGRARRG